MPAAVSTSISGSMSLTAFVAASTYCGPTLTPVPISSDGSATMMFGFSMAIMLASASESAQTIVARPTSSARLMVSRKTASVNGFSQWFSMTPSAPAATSDSGRMSARPRPGRSGSMCGAKTWMREVAAFTRAISTIGVVKIISTSYFFDASSAAMARSMTSCPNR